jgi:hypothetical protein
MVLYLQRWRMELYTLSLTYIGNEKNKMSKTTQKELEAWIDGLEDEKKAVIAEIVILTVKDIREQIARDILATIPLWERQGWLKSRRTRKAFEAGAAIARGQNETVV